MTTTTTPPTIAAPSRSVADQARRLVRFDSLLCLASGASLVAGARPLTDLAGVEPLAPTVAAGVFLLALGAGLAFLARAEVHVLRALLPWSGEGDLLWAAGSAAVAVMVDLTGPGSALVLAQAAVVALVGDLIGRPELEQPAGDLVAESTSAQLARLRSTSLFAG